jgi:hypothetical protein
MKKLILAIVFLFLSGNAYSQINLEWYANQNNMLNIYGNPSDKSLTIDSIGNVYTVSYITDSISIKKLVTTKYNNSGQLIWSRFCNVQTYSGAGDYPCLIKKLHNNKIAVLYNFLEENNHNKIGLLIYDADGFLIYNTKYKINNNEDNYVKEFDTDKFDNIYVTGYSYGGYSKFITLKFNSVGNLVWEKIFADPSQGFDVITDSLCNVYVCGAADTNCLLKTYMLTVKYDSSGAMKWKRLYGYNNTIVSGDDKATQIRLDDSSNIIIGGSCFANSFYQSLAKYKPNGELCWVKLNTSMMGAFNITTDPKCNIYVSGYTEEIPGKIFKYDAGGNLKTTFSSTTEYLYLIKYFQENYIFAAGNKRRGTINQRDFYFAIMDTNLNIIGSYDFLADSSVVDYYSSMLFDNNGNVILSGVCNYDNLYPPQYKFSVIKLSQTTGIKNISNIIADNFVLSQNYPNPFNPSTTIKFQIKDLKFVTLKVYDILGKEVATLVNEKLSAGEYEVQFPNDQLTNAQLPSGVYFYSLFVEGNLIDTKKMVLIK